MSFISDPIVDCVKCSGYKFSVNAAFDIVLSVQKLFREELPDSLKVEQALRMFVVNQRHLKKISVQDKVELLNEIYRECVNTKQRPATKQQIPTFDFEYDAEYIFASFMLDYGIDLVESQGALNWKKFIALFQGLSEQTKIREVMRIRGMEVPRYNGKNQKQIQQIQELKAYYALPARGGGGQEGLEALFSALEAQATKG